MPAIENGILANKAPNTKTACTLALMMHSIFRPSLGVGFSTLLAKFYFLLFRPLI